MKKSFVLHHVLPLTFDQVQAALLDMRVFGQYHPVMEKVTKIDDENYRVFEFSPLPFGLRIRFQYPAQVSTGTEPGFIRYRAIAQGMLILLTFQLKWDPSLKQTLVTESVELSGFFLFLWPLARTIEKCHRQLFENLGRNRLGSKASGD